MSALVEKPSRMTANEFVAWAEEHPGRYELFDGDVVAMAPERVAHARAKLKMVDRLRQAIDEAGLPCEALIDGVGLIVDEHTVFIPDAMVQCGDPLNEQSSLLDDAVILLEVLSPSTRAIDLSIKLEQYFRVASVHHYLIVRTDRPAIIHHQRTADGIITHFVQPGPLRLEPPGITLRLD